MLMLNELSDYLKLHSIPNARMVRLGRKAVDGGYIVPDVVLKGTNVLFNYGVGDDASFERDFIHLYPDKTVRSFDHTIQTHPEPTPGIVFYREGLSAGVTSNTNSFENHLTRLGDRQSLVFLKVDIEGAEYEYFRSAEIDVLTQSVCGIILELHWLEERLDDALAILARLTPHFKCVHWHNNNWGGIFTDGNMFFPTVVELTMVNSIMFPLEEAKVELPRANDVPCRPNMPEFHFDLDKGSEVNRKQMLNLALTLRDQCIQQNSALDDTQRTMMALQNQLIYQKEALLQYERLASIWKNHALYKVYRNLPVWLRRRISRIVFPLSERQ